MKRSFHLPHLSTLVHERLAALDATKLPAAALAQIERDVLSACQRVVLRTVTGPRIGRAVAAALAAPAATEGCKGAHAPLPSSLPAPKALEGVAGQTSNPASIPESETPSGVSAETKGVPL